MAAKKSKGKGKSKGKRSGHHGQKKGGKRPRRRNPPTTFMGNLGHVVAASAVAVVAGTLVLAGQQRIAPGSNASLYGVPAAGVLLGALIAKKAPTIGVGMAVGSVAGPFTLPIATKVLNPSASSPAKVAALAAVQLGAVTMGDYNQLLEPDTMYDVDAVQMGTVHAYG